MGIKKNKNELEVKLIETKTIINMSDMFHSMRICGSLNSLPDM